MKKIKKIMAMLLAMVMVLGMTVTASAAEPGNDGIVGTSDDKGTITVSGIAAETGNENLKVIAYPIVKAKYDQEKDIFTGYEVVYKNVKQPINLEEKDESGNIKIAQAHLNAVIGALDDQNGKYNMTTNSEGNYTKTVPVGSYLVVVSGAEAKVYSPMVVSVNYVNQEGNNEIQDGKVTTIEDGNAWVKETDQPNFTKVEKDKTGKTEDETKYGNSVNVGSKVEYTLTINPVPYYGGSHPVFNVVDTLDAGLTYDANSLKVQLVGSSKDAQAEDQAEDLVEGTDYTFTQDNKNPQKLTVDFVVNNKYTLNDKVTADTNCKIVITYKATLNDKASLAANTTPYGENVNTAVLNYTKDSKVSDNTVKDTIEEKTYTYSFDLNNFLTKTNEKGEVTGDLAGAKFGLYTDEKCTKAYKNTFNTSNTSNDSSKDGFYFTDGSGKLSIKGLEAGIYYLKELEAPNGYSVNTHVFKIEIGATYADTDAQGKDEGQLTSWTLKVDENQVTVDKDKNPNGFVIKNTKLSSLPSTGGIGTTIFTIAGCAIMVAAAGLFFASRRKANK